MSKPVATAASILRATLLATTALGLLGSGTALARVGVRKLEQLLLVLLAEADALVRDGLLQVVLGQVAVSVGVHLNEGHN